MPPGLYGARKGRNSADASLKATVQMDAAKANVGKPFLAPACFDRLLLPAIEELTRQANMPALYAKVVRRYSLQHAKVPMDGWLHVPIGPSPCGIPQGCTFAPLFANLTAAVWEYCAMQFPRFQVFSYLDDRLILGG